MNRELERRFGKPTYKTPDTRECVSAAGKLYMLRPRSTSRSRVWGAWLIQGGFLGVFTWTRKGGLYKAVAWHILAARLESEIPDVRDRLILQAVIQIEEN